METGEVIINGKKIFYRSKGKGPAIVLLHGFAEEGSIWKQQFDIFTNHRLIIPDLPGSGGSEITDDMSIDGMAVTINEFLKASGIRRCILIGHSMGGYITLAYAEKFKDSLNGFGLVHSTAYPDSNEKIETRNKGISFIEQQGAYEFLKISIPNLYSPITKKMHPQFIEEQISSSHNFSAASLVSYYKAMIHRPDRTKVLIDNELPVLFILGKYDTATPLKDGLQLCHMPWISYIHILENSGHMGMIEESSESNKALINYITRIDHQAR
jgi:pimeloyl-ACP methyl ester carboxylesterase